MQLHDVLFGSCDTVSCCFILFCLVSVSQVLQEIIYIGVRCHLDTCAISLCELQPLKLCLMVSFRGICCPAILFVCSNSEHFLSSMPDVSFEMCCMRPCVSLAKKQQLLNLTMIPLLSWHQISSLFLCLLRWPIKPLAPTREACWWLRGDQQSSLLVNDCAVVD